MRSFALCVLLILSFFSLRAQKFVIEGEIAGFPDSTLFLISPFPQAGEKNDDSSRTAFHLIGGRFRIEGLVAGTVYYSIRNQPDTPLEFESVGFWLHPGKTSFVAVEICIR